MEIILTLSICGNVLLAFLVWYFVKLYRRAESELFEIRTALREEARKKLVTGIALMTISALAFIFSNNSPDDIH